MTEFTRTVQGQEVPIPGTYAIDPAHTRIGFSVKHMGIARVRGTFSDFSGTITIGETQDESRAEFTIQSASIDTGQSQRDEHLRSNDFLDMPNHPTVEFRSTKFEPDGDEWKVHGDLTVRGVTRPVTLDVEFEGAGPDVLGDPQQPRVGFSAETKIIRDDFGVNWNQALETGGWVVGKEVKIELNVEAVRQ